MSFYKKGGLNMSHHISEVTRLLEQINAEYESARNCMYGLVAGVAQHQFITARMERMEVLHQELRTHVGEQAMVLIAQQLDGAETPSEPSSDLSQQPIPQTHTELPATCMQPLEPLAHDEQ